MVMGSVVEKWERRSSGGVSLETSVKKWLQAAMRSSEEDIIVKNEIGSWLYTE